MAASQQELPSNINEKNNFLFSFFKKNPAMTEMARGEKNPFVIAFMSHINYIAGCVAITTTSHIR